MKNTTFLFFAFFITANYYPAAAQQTFSREARDQVWLFGYGSFGGLPFGGSIMDFSTEPPEIAYDSIGLDFEITNGSICNAQGELQLYTNGLEVADAGHTIIENGGGLNPDPYTDVWIQYGYYSMIQSVLLLPIGNEEKYLLLHSEKRDRDELDEFGHEIIVNNLFSTSIEKTDSAYAVFTKNNLILKDTFPYGQITACRHANGRDWWVLMPEYFSEGCHRLLVQDDSVIYKGIQEMEAPFVAGVGQACFSPDGKKYVRYNLHYWGQDQYLEIYDFDRCSGLLSNPQYLTVKDSAWFAGAAISENSRFLYVSSFLQVYQYDLEAEDIEASRVVVAEYDGFVDVSSTVFFLAQLAPNGKIYISTPGTSPRLHVIHHPNRKGEACEVEQHGITLPAYNWRSMPNHAYYGLGPEDGSPCDTLGIDLPAPQAAFEYLVRDSSSLQLSFYDGSYFQPHSWSWDFGDGQNSNERHPQHSYAEPGLYEVCLTVENAQGSHTACQEIGLLISGNNSLASSGTFIQAYPNPSAGPVRFRYQLPPAYRRALLRIVDVNGRELWQQAVTGTEGELEWPAAVPPGLYFYQLLAEGRPLRAGKVVRR